MTTMPETTNEAVTGSAQRIRTLRGRLGLNQDELAKRLGVTFVTISRWESGKSEPNATAEQKITALEEETTRAAATVETAAEARIDFRGDARAVQAIAEGERARHGFLYNPAFAKETSLIDPLPHQQLAVYQHMQRQPRLRFLLADDPGAGKTIMAGLDIKERLSRRLVRRVLIVAPAGLVGNWEREMRTLFHLRFRIVTGADARTQNPFLGPDSDLVIVSLDTLRQLGIYRRLQEPEVEPYDYAVFDEAHKLSADMDTDGRLVRSERYRLAEALAGARVTDERWHLEWSCAHLLLLSATPHMGKDIPYYALWRLLLPDVLATRSAFKEYPPESRQNHFLRRTKEEMVSYEGESLYAKRLSQTFQYKLSPSERRLYDDTTEYIQEHYNQAQMLNRSAARLAMSVFQRRLASSSYALLRSFQRRAEKLDTLITTLEARPDAEIAAELQRRQNALGDADVFDSMTAEEETAQDGEEENEQAEDTALGGVAAQSLADLQRERVQVQGLLSQAQAVYSEGAESKFEKLRGLIQSEAFQKDHGHPKILVFTEHRDTQAFLAYRLEGIGYAGRVAQIHGGMGYQERQEQIEFFRRPASEGGADFLIGTDAAGEGINLQFCWLMVNYDLPWNPARLEQRMGRIHRYGQKKKQVYIYNLVSEDTREGKVLKTLLDKLEAIRQEFNKDGNTDTDKVYDVIGRLFSGKSLQEFFENPEGLETLLTAENVAGIERKQEAALDVSPPAEGTVRERLPTLRQDADRETYRRLLPGYVRRFVETAAPLVGIGFDGSLDDAHNGFTLRPLKPGALDALGPALEQYGPEQRRHLLFTKPPDPGVGLFLHPGEPVFDLFFHYVQERLAPQARRGAVFVDPHATRPYLFHLAEVTVERAADPAHRGLGRAEGLEHRLIGFRQEEGGEIIEWPLERLLLLRPWEQKGLPVTALRTPGMAAGSRDKAEVYAREHLLPPLVQARRAALLETLPARELFLRRGFDYQESDLAARRADLRKKRDEDVRAMEEMAVVRDHQKQLAVQREAALAALRREPELIQAGTIEFLCHALVVPTGDPAERQRLDAETEAEAVRYVREYEEARGAEVVDVSTPERARNAGLEDWPGFDLLVRRDGVERAVEVKGRADFGSVELTENEWIKACNLRDRFWLYVVYRAGGLLPRLYRVRDPFGVLSGRARQRIVIDERDIMEKAETD